MPIQIDQVIADRYRIIEVLGVGGMAIVYQAMDMRLQRLVAIKVIQTTQLMDKSLIRQADQESREPRLLMLETIREYAVERLDQDPEFRAAARRAHASYYADFTKRQWERLLGDGREAALEGLVSDIENVRSAWSYWVEERDLEQLSKFVDSLWLLNDAQGWYHATVNLTKDLLNILSSTPSTPELAQQEIVLQTSLARALLAIKGYTLEVEQAYLRALELSRVVGEIPQLFPVLRGLSNLYTYLGEHEKGAQIGEKILSLAERQDDTSMRVEGHLVFGYNLAFYKNIRLGLDHLEKAIEYFDPNQQRSSRFRLGNNPGVVCFTVSGLLLWMLGFPDRALKRANEAIDLAKRLNHPYSMAYAMFHSGLLHLWRGEVKLVEDRAQAVLDIAEKHEFQVWRAVAICLHGAALAGMDQAQEGLAQVRRGMLLYQGLKTPPIFWPLLLQIQAGVCTRGGKPEEGLALLNEGMEIASHWSGRTMLPEFLRLKGELLLAITPENAAEAGSWFQQALDVAQELGARMLELRAAISLCRLWRDQGKAEQGRRVLNDAYERFTEGFTTADLMEAEDLLRQN